MTRRTETQWRELMQACAESGLTAKAFCEQHAIKLQTFYARRHSLRQANSSNVIESSAAQHNGFVRAQVLRSPSHIVMQTRDAQLSLPSHCDPIWLAKLLKELSA